ncbi:PAS domain S-box protein [Roseomonas chloroacetimidivorans]|uniref:PAS domain S-box protein n=1 Tax=Roseomonas chloroacetimidivorans TaxID=1766656 RepID=UPI003C74C2BD
MTDEPAVPDLSGSVGALSATLLGAAMDVAGLAVMITDARLERPGPSIRYVNARFEAMTGYSAAEVIGLTPRILQGPRTERATLDRLRQALEDQHSFIGHATNYRKNGDSYINEWIISPIRAADGTLTHWLSIQRDGAMHGVPAEALRERTGALLATVREIAAQSLSVPEEGAAFNDRLAALSRAQALPDDGATVETVLREALEPFPAEAQVTLLGPRIVLPRGMVEPLALALHELAANAARHGALRLADGRLAVTWRVQGSGAERGLLLEWRERGVALPDEARSRRGYGRQVIEEALVFALSGETELRFEAEGLSCRITLPLPG